MAEGIFADEERERWLVLVLASVGILFTLVGFIGIADNLPADCAEPGGAFQDVDCEDDDWELALEDSNVLYTILILIGILSFAGFNLIVFFSSIKKSAQREQWIWFVLNLSFSTSWLYYILDVFGAFEGSD